jgi:hypothetical protein
MHQLRFRQVHLDFHTSPAIEQVGAAFDKNEWQEALKRGHIDSITCFSKCHHGYNYHPTRVGKMHPHLNFDLLSAQFHAAKELGINVPIYVSTGVDNLASYEHPEWREIDGNGQFAGLGTGGPLHPYFHKLCFNSPYVDYLYNQIREAVELFPQADGFFLDIVFQGQCCCKFCLDWMHERGLDARDESSRKQCAEYALKRYLRETTAACRIHRPDMPVFHNSGHIARGRRDVLQYFSHLELESLPTGGWGYDHFPLSAAYCTNLPHQFLGMTGKFHTTWGEFGGFKHPNALRYECAAMLAYGARCSIGDQLHPSGRMDASTYALIGAAYSEVQQKEPWCVGAQSVADVGLLSSAAMRSGHQGPGLADHPDTGASRLLLEGHFLFDVLDSEMEFSKYRALILPDDVRITDDLKKKLDAYLAAGGKLMLTGQSGLTPNDSGFAFDIGASWHGESEFQPDYILPHEILQPSFVHSPWVMYLKSQRIKTTSGQSLGDVYDPYFNRAYHHFCSHQHTPPRTDASGFACAVRHNNILYVAHPIFSLYSAVGAVVYRHYFNNLLRQLLDAPTVQINAPSTARVTLKHQADHSRYVLHLLYASKISRGSVMEMSGGTLAGKSSIEVIEELLPLHDIDITLRLPHKPLRAILQPQGTPIALTTDGDTLVLHVDQFTCHQMIALEYGE